MVDRLEIIPGDVRGGGNITIPKNFSEDKNTNVYSTFLSENQAEIDGRWMPTFHSYYSNWYQLTVESDAPRIVSPGGDASFNVTVSNPARENVNGVHVDVSLRSKDGENEYWASSFVIMDNQPSFTLWIPEDCDKYCEWFIHATQGGSNGVGLHRSVIVADVTDISLDAFGDKQIIQTGETCNVIGLLSGKLGESVIGIPGQTVNFYETFTPGLKVDVIPEIIQVGEQSCITTQLIDTSDGSLIREEGLPVKIYDDVGFRSIYSNDGTDPSTLYVLGTGDVTVEDGCLKLSTDAEEDWIYYLFEVTPDNNYEYECTVGKVGDGASFSMYVKYPNDDLGCWFAYDVTTGKWNGGMTGTTFSNVNTGTLKAGDRIRIKQQYGVVSLYHNGKVIFSKTAGFRSGSYRIGHSITDDMSQYIKNISVISFDNVIELSTTKPIVDYSQEDIYSVEAELKGLGELDGQTIDFYINNTYAGSSVTRNGGIAYFKKRCTGAGDVTITAKCGNATSNSLIIEDCLQVFAEPNHTGFTSVWADAPVKILGEMVKEGAWGGTRIYGGNGVTASKEYVFLSQNSGNTSEDELIRYNVGNSWVSFECTIHNNLIDLWINGYPVAVDVPTGTTDGKVYVSGGSTANPVNMRNVRIKPL